MMDKSWISTKERTPDVSEFLGISRFNSDVRAYRKRSWNPEFTVGGLDIAKDIVWWMPLPEPPNSKKVDAPVESECWIEDNIDLMCPVCGHEYSYEIVCMSKTDYDTRGWLRFCPACGEQLKWREYGEK